MKICWQQKQTKLTEAKNLLTDEQKNMISFIKYIYIYFNVTFVRAHF